MAAPGFQTWGGDRGASVLAGGQRKNSTFTRVSVLFLNVGFLKFKNDKSIFFALRVAYFSDYNIQKYIEWMDVREFDVTFA